MYFFEERTVFPGLRLLVRVYFDYLIDPSKNHKTVCGKSTYFKIVVSTGIYSHLFCLNNFDLFIL